MAARGAKSKRKSTSAKRKNSLSTARANKLAAFGFTGFLVLMAGGLVMGVIFAALAFGLVALKVAVFIVLPAWLLWRLFSWMFRRREPRPKPTQPGTSEA